MNLPDLSHLNGSDGVLTAAVLYAARMLRKVEHSISLLNTKMGRIIEKTAWHERELERHDKEIDKLKGYHGKTE